MANKHNTPILDRLNQHKKDIINAYIEHNTSTSKLARIYHCSAGSITKFLKKNNVILKPPNTYKIYTVNETFFDNIDTENKAYITGFWFADGCLSQKNNNTKKVIVLTISEKDKLVIEKIKEILEYTGPLNYRPSQLKKNTNYICKPTYTLYITSEKLFNALYKLGCIPRKSLILEYPSLDNIPRNLMHSFIRGYFDGDGGICRVKKEKKYRISITSSTKFIYGLAYFLTNEINIAPHIYQRGKVHTLYIFKKSDVEKFLDYIYKDINKNSLYIFRKYDIYQEFKRFIQS